MSIQFKDGRNDSWRVLERVVLVEAWDHEEALKKATSMALQEQEEYTGPGYRWDGGRPADVVFLGVRKVICVSATDGGGEVSLADGQELTCWEYDVAHKDDLKRLADGEPVGVEYY